MKVFETGYPLGWLSPDGQLFECGYTKHFETAEEIVKTLTTEKIFLPDEYLLGHGWVHLTEISVINLTEMFITGYGWAILFPYSDKLSIDQHNFLKPYVEEYKNFLAEGFTTNLKYEYPDLFPEFYEDFI